MPTRPTTPPPGPAPNHTAVVRRRRSLARHTALAAFCWAWGAWGLSTALATATWATVAALAASGLWAQRHRFIIDEYSGIEHRHQVTQALGGER